MVFLCFIFNHEKNKISQWPINHPLMINQWPINHQSFINQSSINHQSFINQSNMVKRIFLIDLLKDEVKAHSVDQSIFEINQFKFHILVKIKTQEWLQNGSSSFSQCIKNSINLVLSNFHDNQKEKKKFHTTAAIPWSKKFVGLTRTGLHNPPETARRGETWEY